MSPSLLTQLSAILGWEINKIVPLSGGDISKAYLLYTKGGRIFCKVHPSPYSSSMFQAEREGLLAIAKTNTIKVPEIIGHGNLEKGACQFLEYIEPGKATTAAMETLGHQLAIMHSVPQPEFGWTATNFIGSLRQSNKKGKHWTSFFVKERLVPQLVLARRENLLTVHDIPPEAVMLEKVQQYIPVAFPSLLHGDLWSGNYLISSIDVPYLLDPAVYYGHHEADLAMTRLFGGFDAAFYNAYYEVIPKAEGSGYRVGLYQLYYLLVHLNLFGKTYYPRVKKLLNTYF